MKKSISAILVAALMLIAFTACEQQVPTIPSQAHELTSVQYVSGPLTYHEGEDFDPSAYQVKLIYRDALNETVSGEAYLNVDSWEISGGSSETIPVYYGSGTGKKEAFSVTLYSAAIDVDITNAVTSVASDIKEGDAVSLTGVTATLKIGNGTTESYPISNLEAVYATGNTVNVTSTEGISVNLVKGNEDATWTVTPDAKPELTVSKIVVGYYTGNGTTKYPFTEVAEEDQPKWIGDEIKNIKVLKVMSDGSMVALADGTADPSANPEGTYTVVKGTLPTGELTKDAKTFEVFYNGDSSKKASITVKGTDYVETIEASFDSASAPKEITSDLTIQKNWFTVKATMASGDSDDDFTKYSFLSTEIPAETDGEYAVWISYVNEQGDKIWDSVGITVTAKED